MPVTHLLLGLFAWNSKSGVPLKGTVGSNPTRSANGAVLCDLFAKTALFTHFLLLLSWQQLWLQCKVEAGDKRLGRVELCRVVQMRVNVGRGRKIAVTEPLLYILHLDAVGEQQTGAAVTKVVEAYAPQAVPVKQLREHR